MMLRGTQINYMPSKSHVIVLLLTFNFNFNSPSIFLKFISPPPPIFFFIFTLLKTGLGILDFYHSDWLNGARLSAHIPAVTKYGQ